MVEVFKTNVIHAASAAYLVQQIQRTFAGYQVNFDLQDCDHILRIVCTTGIIAPQPIIELLKDFGFQAEVLPDAVSAVSNRYHP